MTRADATIAGERASDTMQIRELARACLGRFFENEITAGMEDLKTPFFWLLSFLAVPGVFMPVSMAFTWDLVAALHGADELRLISRGDKTFYLGFAMIATGAVAAITWTSLLPDRRDGLIMGTLPVRPGVVVAAKLAALVAYLSIVAGAMHLLSSVAFGMLLGSRGTMAFAIRGVVAHFVASCAASAFVVLSITGVQGLMLAAAGPRWSARLAPVLQVCIVALITVGFLGLPILSVSVPDTLAASGPNARAWILATPPLWFLGMYEWLLGAPGPVLTQLGLIGGAALALSATVTIACYPLAYARTMRAAVEQAGRPTRGRGRRPVSDIAAALLARHPGTRAIVQFLLVTIGRVERHRFVMAASIGVAAVWGLPTWSSAWAHPPALPRGDLLALPLSTMTFLLVGARVAMAVPSDLRSAWVFALCTPAPRHARAAAERSMLALIVCPIVAIFGPVYWYLWGARVAVLHTGVSLLLGLLLVEALLWRFTAVTCTRPWDPEALNLGKRWLPYVAAFVVFTVLIPRLEASLILDPTSIGALMLVVLLAAAIVRWISSRPRPDEPIDLEAQSGVDVLQLN
jgi:hypothetical protein